MDVFCGIDWAEGHHDVAIVDDTGKVLAKCRINEDLDGYRLLVDLLAEHGDAAETPIPVEIETSRGLLVATLRQGPRKIYAVNPMAASRYRDRHGVSRKKSDPGDALVLANITAYRLAVSQLSATASGSRFASIRSAILSRMFARSPAAVRPQLVARRVPRPGPARRPRWCRGRSR